MRWSDLPKGDRGSDKAKIQTHYFFYYTILFSFPPIMELINLGILP